MNEQFSTLSGWMIPFSRAMEAHDIDVEQALVACGISMAVMKDQESRIAAECFEKLLDYCNQKLNRHDFDIIVAQHFHPATFHVLGYAMMSSNTLKDALMRIAQYKRVVSNTCELIVEENAHQLIFQMKIFSYKETDRLVLSLNSVIAFLATIVKFSSELIGSKIRTIKLLLPYQKPSHDIQYLTDFFNCPVVWNQPFSALIIDAKQANSPILGANILITQTHEKLLRDFLSRTNQHDLSHLVRSKIYDLLPLGLPPQSAIAKDLGMSLRNLQRKLNEQGSNYKEILEDTRKSLTLDYMHQPHLSLGEISYLVGFSNLSNFNRAFKRWTKTTPGEYRSKL